MNATSKPDERPIDHAEELRDALGIRAALEWGELLECVTQLTANLRRALRMLDNERAANQTPQEADLRAKLAQQARVEKTRADGAERELKQARAQLNALRAALGDMIDRVSGKTGDASPTAEPSTPTAPIEGADQ